MTLNDLYDDWDDISYDKKIRALEEVVTYLEGFLQKDDALVKEMLLPCVELESEDYFGTEGLKID